jgi:hypothetical protein
VDDQTQELIKENIRLTRENNRLLRKLWRVEVFSFWSKILFIIIMIGVPLLIYQYFLADVLHDTLDTYQSLMSSAEHIQSTAENFSLSSVLGALEQLGTKAVE